MASSPRKQPLEITWRIFFALTGGCASGLLLLGLPLLAFGTLLAGLGGPDDRKQLMFFWLAGLFIAAWAATCAIALIKSGPRASNRMHMALWSIGLIAPFATVVAMSKQRAREVQRARQEYARTHTAEQIQWRDAMVRFGHAEQLARVIAECTNLYAKAHTDQGYPSTLQQISSAGDKCAQTVAALEGGDVRVNYSPALRDASGRVPAFAVCAEPVTVAPGANAKFFDDLGEIPANAWVGRCHDKVFVDIRLFRSNLPAEAYARRLKYCAFDFAAQHPDRGYPAELAEIETCATADRVTRDAQTLRFDGAPVIEYKASAPDSSGRTTSFLLEHRAACNDRSGGTLSVIADVTARLHVAMRCRPARLSDPLLAEFDSSVGEPLTRKPPPPCTARFPLAAKIRVTRWPEPNQPPSFDAAADPTGYRSEVAEGSLRLYDRQGRRLWQKELPGKIFPAPAIENNRIYVLNAGQRTATLHAIRVTGEEDWSLPFEVAFSAPPVARKDGSVYLSAGSVYAIDANGALKWISILPTPTSFEPAIGRSGNLYVVAGSKMYGLDGDNGGICWSVPIGMIDDTPVAPALIRDGLIYTRTQARMVDVFTESK
jgi:putative pyrroloquinoline-quinone binding quinoprotein